MHNCQHLKLKGTVSQDFLLQVFFMNQFPQPQSIPLGLFQFFSKIRRDTVASQGAPLVSTTSAEILSPVSLVLLIPVANNGNNIKLLRP
jgi:hypothetical protein